MTGASRGIGKAIADKFASEGACVIGTATTGGAVDDITARLKKIGGCGTGLVLDISDKNSIRMFSEQLNNNADFPGILVNNAGITRDNLLLRMKDEEWDTVINTNLGGLYQLCKLCLRPMMKARRGRIINIGSVVGLTGNAGQVNYATAKAGIIGFSRSLARETGSRGITVNVVAPGFIETDMTAGLSDEHRMSLLEKITLGRLGNVDDVANAVAFLASREAAYITGQTLNVNGGMYMG